MEVWEAVQCMMGGGALLGARHRCLRTPPHLLVAQGLLLLPAPPLQAPWTMCTPPPSATAMPTARS